MMMKKMKMKATTKKTRPNRVPKKIEGTITALITPFYKGNVDYQSLKKLVRHQLDNGIEGFVINGTTAESPTLQPDEVEKIFKFVRKVSDNSLPLILGTGSNSTADTIKKTKWVTKLKATAALVVVPYYNKPPQRGLMQHFTQVAKLTQVPIIVYNVPGRTITSLQPDTAIELAKLSNIIGIKEASGDISYVHKIKSNVPNDYSILSGDDATAIDFVSAGGQGVISVISHVIPKEFSILIKRTSRGDARAYEEYSRYSRLNQLLGIESNPIPVKKMLNLMGIIRSDELRLPLVALAEENTNLVRQELKKLGII